MTRLWVVVRKEWDEVFKNPMVLWTVIATPILLLATTGVTMGLIQSDDSEMGAKDLEELRALAGPTCVGITDPHACLETYMGTMMLEVLLLLPAILPGVFAAYSVVGEKTGRTLEPLLATPIRTWELLGGKCVAAVVPALAGTFAALLAFYAIVFGMGSPEAARALAAPSWLVLESVASPLLVVLAVQLAIIVSSRVQDPRVAQQLSGLVVLPMLGVMGATTFGVIGVSTTTVTVGIVVLAGLVAIATFLANELFEREAILTRWK